MYERLDGVFTTETSFAPGIPLPGSSCLRFLAEKLDGDTEKYEYQYCLCGALKRHRYHYIDSQDDAQDMDWTLTTDKLGRVEKEYYPYAIAKQSGDEYHSLLFEYDTASRRTAFSDPTFGHTCPDTSGWSGHVEPDDEDNWAFDEPLRYLFAAEGNLRALGRVKGSGIREGEGEPYFVRRDEAGRVASVIYPNKMSTKKPEYEMRYEYAADGRIAETAPTDPIHADWTVRAPVCSARGPCSR